MRNNDWLLHLFNYLIMPLLIIGIVYLSVGSVDFENDYLLNLIIILCEASAITLLFWLWVVSIMLWLRRNQPDMEKSNEQ